MATQHPDHASVPFWQKNSAFIPAVHETQESFTCFKDLNTDEYMWDWEGKLVDESVVERMLADHYDYFKTHQLGKNKFLTFRLPNPKVQHEFRMSRALMGILTATGLARQTQLHAPPLFEVILPMTETAEELIAIQEAFKEIACLRHPLNRMEENCEMFLEVIPLFETVNSIIHSHKILEKYLALYEHKFKSRPKYLRPFVARSDPALNSGLVPTVLAIKLAFSRYLHFSKKHRLPLYPIIGAGTLPFRGGLNPNSPEAFCAEYRGVKTTTIQSAFRYDFPKAQVKKALTYFNETFPKHSAKTLSPTEEQTLIQLTQTFEAVYQPTVESLAPLINQVALHFPKRRERVQHIGLFGYSRGTGKVRLPRAISFTGSLYALGLPPELIGTGRGIKTAIDNGTIQLLEKTYLNLKTDLLFAGQFLYKPGLLALSKKFPGLKQVWQDVQALESYLLTEFSAQTPQAKAHQQLSAQLHKQIFTQKSLTKLIEKQAVLRHSLG